jgi:hypothetical protein
MPEMTPDAVEIWNMYANVGHENIIVSLDLYHKHIGLPCDWDFDECLNVIGLLTNQKHKLDKAKAK